MGENHFSNNILLIFLIGTWYPAALKPKTSFFMKSLLKGILYCEINFLYYYNCLTSKNGRLTLKSTSDRLVPENVG